MNNEMNNKTYLIIGGTGGIGQAMVQQLIQKTTANQTDNQSNQSHRTQVFATYHRNEPNIEAENLHWLPMNVSNEDSIKKAAEARGIQGARRNLLQDGQLTGSPRHTQLESSQE